MIFNDTYRKYFEHQAINHPELGHDTTGKVFEMIDVEEALGDFRTAGLPKGYIMRVLHYTYGFEENEGTDALKQINGGFIIARHHSSRKDGKEGLHAAMLGSEMIVDEIIEKMVADSKNGHPLFYQSLNKPKNFSVQPKIYTGDVGYSGWLCLFHISNFWRNCVIHPTAPKWLDLGVTPHEL